MATGLIIYNEDGSVQFDSTTFLLVKLASFDTGASAGSTTFTNPGIGEVLVAQSPVAKGQTEHTITVSGSTVSWSGGNASSSVQLLVK